MYMYLTGTELEMKHLQKLYEGNEWTPSFAEIAQPDTVKDVPHAGQKRKASQGKQNGDAKLKSKKKDTKSKLHDIMHTVHTRNQKTFAAKFFCSCTSLQKLIT